MAAFCVFPGMLHFVNAFKKVPLAPVIAGITAVVTSHIRRIDTVPALCCKTFLSSFLIAFLSPEVTTS
jgi:hypothetical protein